MSRVTSTTTTIAGCLGIALSSAVYLHAAQSAGSIQSAASTPRAVLDKYCVTCHNDKLRTANLALDKMDVDHVGTDAEVWEKVVRKLRSAAMPPVGMPRPDPATYESVAKWLETELDRSAEAKLNPGRPAVHRLNRVEYTNAIRDLLGLEIDGRALLPADESGYGFDNMADVLGLSAGLLERYMLAAQKVSRLAIGDTTIRPAVSTYTLSLALKQEERMSEELPFGSRGGTVIRHYFPLDGEYVVRIRMRRGFNNGLIRGLEKREQVDLRLDGERLKLFAIGGECVGSTEARCTGGNSYAATTDYNMNADAGLDIRFPAKAGTRSVGVAFLRQNSAAAEGSRSRQPVGLANSTDDMGVEMEISTVQVEGPLGATSPGETPARRQIFVCRPTAGQDAELCAKKILTKLARRAYRRPATDSEVETLLGFYRKSRAPDGFDAGIQLALEGLLVSPNFLMRIERDPAGALPGSAYRIGDFELASRLSFFLWSSIPDDELLDVAGRGGLKNPAVLEQQVRRMLADTRSTALVSNFGGQWLYLRNLRTAKPDPRIFPEFDENLRDAFLRETEMFFESQLREDRNVIDLLRANYTFLNERLARFYGIPNVYGSHFRRVTLNDDRRAGLLGQASILTVTSYATRTSPVLRGKWLLENILGAPPPPPPPNVPALKENSAAIQPTSVRERLEQHRNNPVCASCHSRMDPLGFALDNFNGIGKWRTTEANAPIDTKGVLPDGTKFDGPADLRKALVTHGEEFVYTVTEKLLTYGLGRGVEYSDIPAIRKILREAGPADYRWSAVILGIVKSTPFQMRTVASAVADNRTLPPLK